MTNTDTDTDVSQTAYAEPERDGVLQILAAGLQASEDQEIQLTVTVGGLLISGIAIGRDRWFRDTAQFMEEMGGSGVIPETLLKGFQEAESSQDAPDPATYGFLHMKDARTIFPHGVVPDNSGPGLYWRGRISEITGFSFGQLKNS